MLSGSVSRSLSVDLPLPDLDRIETLPQCAVRRFASTRVSTDVTQRILPWFDKGDEVQRISKNTMVEVMNGKWKEFYDALYIIDCRFSYEYEGGHLPNAININTPSSLNKLFFEVPAQRAVVIFHCEYSRDRGPTMAKLFRNFDRRKNERRWPHLDYPDTYVLDGGYKGFYEEHPELCEGGYVAMRDDRHLSNLIKENSTFKCDLEMISSENRENREKQMLLKNREAKVTKTAVGFTSPILPKRIHTNTVGSKRARRSLHICNL